MKPFLFNEVIVSLHKVFGMHICDEVFVHMTRSLTRARPLHLAHRRKGTGRKMKKIKARSLLLTMLIQSIKPTSLHGECFEFISVVQELSRK